MCQAQASKIALFGAADYSWNPNAFDVHKNWEEVFHRIAEPGDTQTAEAIKCFARFSNTLVEDEEMITLSMTISWRNSAAKVSRRNPTNCEANWKILNRLARTSKP